jgi:DNA-binding transcriptional LysR family regulator
VKRIVKRIDMWRAKLKVARAEMKIVTRQANSLNKRQSALTNLINELETKIGAVLAKA